MIRGNMIRRLRRRMTLMVIAVLILVSAGIVLATHLAGQRSITAQAESTLSVLAENRGSRPSRSTDARGPADRNETPPPKPGEDGFVPGESDNPPPPDPEGEDDLPARDAGNRRRDSGQPPEIRSDRAVTAGLSNSYTITLNEDGSVSSWTSDRTDLYSDSQIAAIAESVQAAGQDSGRIGTQFYRKAEKNGQTLLIVLDARLDCLSASNTLRSTILIAGGACLLLSLLAWLLIRKMVQPVEDAFVRQKRFVSDASHELKTPLAVISANAEVLEQEIGKNEYLDYIRSEVRRTDSLVRNLLTLARMDRNDAAAEMKRFDLSRAVLDVTLPFESTVYEAGKTLDIQVPDGIDCFGNEEMIKQLTVILLSNALKYSDPGGRIEIGLKAQGKQRELRVFNTGEAIDPDDREKVFDRFWRADPAHGRDTGGHGLGLAIAKTIVEVHKGRITVDSREGEGTAFTVTLPGRV